MKLNFRKIASVLTSTVMLSSTLAFAAAANYPAPFVQGGNADVAIVYGSNPAANDYAAVLEINSQLTGALAGQTASGGTTSGSSTVTGGDFVKLERASDNFNLGDGMDDFYSNMDDDQLSKVLASGVYSNDANDDFEYDQSIKLAGLTLEHFQDDDYSDKPAIGFDLTSGEAILNYTLEFTPDAAEGGGTDLPDLEKTELPLLGRTYYIARAQNTTNGAKLTLLDTANSATVKEGETQTVTVGNSSYEISTSLINDNDDVIFVINGVNSGKKLTEGDVYKIAGDTYIAVKNVNYNPKESGISSVDFSIGSGKIVLENGQEVEINNDAISDVTDSILNTYITKTGNDIDSIKLEWIIDEDMWITPTTSLSFPGFNTIKLSMGEFNLADKEMTTLEGTSASASQIKLSTELKEGDLSGLHLLYANSSDTGFVGLGKDSTHRLVTNGTVSPTFLLNETENSYFGVTWTDGNDEAESYVFEINGITDDSGKNSTSLNNLVSGGKDVTIKEVSDDEDVGSRITLTLVAASDNSKTALIKATPVSSGTVYGDRLVTKAGLQMRLPVANQTGGDGTINVTAPGNNVTSNPSTWVMNFAEEDKDDNIADGGQFNVTLGFTSSDGAQVRSITGVTEVETADSSDDFEGYKVSDLATKTLRKTGGDQDSLDIEYHGTEAFADVFVSEAGAAISSTGGSTSTGGTKVLGSVAVTDSDVSTVSGKNLIVVGGSCVNTVAAELLGLSYPSCGSAWETKTGVGAGSFLIQTFARSNNKIATLVAGYNQPDTSNAAMFLTKQSVDTMVGKKYTGTSATSASLATTSSSSGSGSTA